MNKNKQKQINKFGKYLICQILLIFRTFINRIFRLTWFNNYGWFLCQDETVPIKL